jgi:electron transport complex protein RnfB
MLLATASLALLTLVLGVLLGLAARVFAVADENPLAKEIEALLPGAQCGQCGFAGCAGAAAALAAGEAALTCCPPGGRALMEQLSALLDLPLEAGAAAAVPQVARIESASCTGCTRCYRACPTDAIVGANGQIHVVLQSACTGCGKCVDACPEDCVTLGVEAPTLDRWHWSKPQAA